MICNIYFKIFSKKEFQRMVFNDTIIFTLFWWINPFFFNKKCTLTSSNWSIKMAYVEKYKSSSNYWAEWNFLFWVLTAGICDHISISEVFIKNQLKIRNIGVKTQFEFKIQHEKKFNLIPNFFFQNFSIRKRYTNENLNINLRLNNVFFCENIRN